MTLAWKQILIAFLLGAMVGVAGARWGPLAPLGHRRWDHGQFHTRLLQQFSAKLKLTTDQRARVAAILEEKRKRMDALRAEIRPKFEEIRAATSTEIRILLTPAQQQAFDVMNAKLEARAKRFRTRTGAPPP